MNEDFELIFIEAEESGERIDALLASNISGLSRSGAQKLIEEGLLLLNGLSVKKNYRCRKGDCFELSLPPTEESALFPQNIPLDIRYEDSDLMVINKPRGMVVHPAPGHPDGTLVNALLYYCGDALSGLGGEMRPGIVHRIDKDSSGLLIVAKNDFAHRSLSAQLADRSLSREYEAVILGSLREPRGTVNKPIGRHETDRKRMAVNVKNGREAVTHWHKIAEYRGYTHIGCKLQTGRTHQIRVHMSSISHPLLGDYTYGAPSPDKGLEGHCLHAGRLSFIHPRGGKISVYAQLPDYFLSVLSKLGNQI